MTPLEGVLKKSTTTLSAWAGLASCACRIFNPRSKASIHPSPRTPPLSARRPPGQARLPPRPTQRTSLLQQALLPTIRVSSSPHRERASKDAVEGSNLPRRRAQMCLASVPGLSCGISHRGQGPRHQACIPEPTESIFCSRLVQPPRRLALRTCSCMLLRGVLHYMLSPGRWRR